MTNQNLIYSSLVFRIEIKNHSHIFFTGENGMESRWDLNLPETKVAAWWMYCLANGQAFTAVRMKEKGGVAVEKGVKYSIEAMVK